MSTPSYPTPRDLLKNKRILVTAAAGTGIGFATAKRCVEEGARVIISDRHARRLAQAASDLGVESVVCDVTTMPASTGSSSPFCVHSISQGGGEE